jgi:ABC-type Fe3+ transport system substrate-binding protein
MRMRTVGTILGSAPFVLLVAGATLALADDLPKATQSVLAKLNQKPEILNGFDKELAVPSDWVEKARQNPTIKVSGSDDVPLYMQLIKPFQERYPFIKLQYDTGSSNERVIKPLIAYRTGRSIADVVFSMDGSSAEYAKGDVSANLADLPAYASALSAGGTKSDLKMAFRARPYCLAYNTQRVPRDRLPKSWADLPNAEILSHGVLGAVMLPHLWMMPLWGKYGEAWAVKYIDDYFKKLQPSVRQEGINATTALVGAGELYASMPAYPERIKELQGKGAPVAWYCPGMIPLNFSSVAVFRNSPGTWGGRLFVNWMSSKEGQLTQLAVFGTPPVHKDLQSPDFHIFPDEIRGKEFISFDDQAETNKFQALWKKYALTNSLR